MQTETVWEFETVNYRIALELSPEETDPKDLFQFQEDIDAIHNGDVAWFAASVVVYKKGHEIGRDALGGCAYKTAEEFYTSHRNRDPMNRNCSLMRAARGDNVVICHYFPDMVRLAIEDGRRTLTDLAA